jgi:transcriptional regulator GlxA family with amidase domain
MLDGMSPTVAPSRPHTAGPAADNAAHPRVGAALAYIHQHLGEPLPLPLLADLARLSVGRFVTVFRLTVGMTPHRYISLKRIRRAQWLLTQGQSPAMTAHECGFYDQSHLTRCLKSVCGMTPRQFQTAGTPPQGNAGRSLRMPIRLPTETAVRWDSAS